MPSIKMLLNYYVRDDRQNEIDFAVEQNKSNPFISKVYYEGLNLPLSQDPMVEHSHPGEYWDFGSFVDKACEIGSPGDIIIIANSDIFFDESLGEISNFDWGKKSLICLGKWNPMGTDLKGPYGPQPFEYACSSHDAWIFKIPKTDFRLNQIKVPLGTALCDTRIAFNAELLGYSVCNPMYSIRAMHAHLGDSKTVDEPAKSISMGAIKTVPPSFLNQEYSWTYNTRWHGSRQSTFPKSLLQMG